ncbi:MAG: DUF3168 domain-containing protein [Sphingomonadales bacterium]|nr:DUF3168 domain-containing protein [Sphingomonadales bacterium]
MMSIDVSWPLRCAVKDKINNDEDVKLTMGKIPLVMDGGASGSADLPFIYIGNTSSQAWHSATFDGQEHELDIHVVAAIDGGAHVQEISGAVINTLHDADLLLKGHALVDLQFERSETHECFDRKQFHTTVSFKALTVSD